MPAFTKSLLGEPVEHLFELATTLENAFSAAGLEYCIVGGFAVYLYVEEAEPAAGRLTPDVDLMVRREDLHCITQAVKPFGIEYRPAAGVNMPVGRNAPSALRALHLVYEGEKVRPEYEQPVPTLSEARRLQGFPLIRLPHLIRMKLTSFRVIDQTHLKDMDAARLITPEIERELTPAMRERLRSVRGVK